MLSYSTDHLIYMNKRKKALKSLTLSNHLGKIHKLKILTHQGTKTLTFPHRCKEEVVMGSSVLVVALCLNTNNKNIF